MNESHSTMHHRRLLSALILGALLTPASALAQVDYDLRTRFAFGWGEEASPITEPIVISQPGTYHFELQEGVFDAVGFTNFGVANWIGIIRASEGVLSRPESPRVAPFNNWIGGNGVMADDRTQIGMNVLDPETGRTGYIDAAAGPVVHHYTDVPPPPPGAHGADEYVALYRFSVTIDDLTPRDIEITAENLSGSRPLRGWSIFQDLPPDPETGEPGLIEYHPLSVGQQYAETAALSLTLLRIVPTPGTGLLGAALLGMAVRRRRAV